jgi:hypothetical protein
MTDRITDRITGLQDYGQDYRQDYRITGLRTGLHDNRIVVNFVGNEENNQNGAASDQAMA